MRIAKNELLAGIPVLKIRDYFRLLYSGLMTRDGLAERFNLNEKETEGLVGELMRYNDQLVDKARKEGKSFSSLIDILGYSEKLVILKLRNKEKYISLHRMTDGILQITACRQIFP